MCPLDNLSLSPQPTLSLERLSEDNAGEEFLPNLFENALEETCSNEIEQLKAEMEEVENDYLTLMKIRKKLEKKMQ